MQFDTLLMRSTGPFLGDQTLRFKAGTNVIQGGNGTGKTTIFRELRHRFLEKFESRRFPRELAIDLVFAGEDYGCDTRSALRSVRAALEFDEASCLLHLPKLISLRLNEIISRKLLRVHGENQRADSGGNRLNVDISGGEIDITDASGVSRNSYFTAHGERLALSLACNLALRDLFEFNNPFVTDGLFEFLDEPLLSDCYQATLRMNCQRIYLISNRLGDKININPDYRLIWTCESRAQVRAIAMDSDPR